MYWWDGADSFVNKVVAARVKWLKSSRKLNFQLKLNRCPAHQSPFTAGSFLGESIFILLEIEQIATNGHKNHIQNILSIYFSVGCRGHFQQRSIECIEKEDLVKNKSNIWVQDFTLKTSSVHCILNQRNVMLCWHRCNSANQDPDKLCTKIKTQ